MMIVVTGVPGTGKSAIAKELAKRTAIELFNITEFVNAQRLYETIGGEKVVDVKRLFRELKKALKGKKNVIVEGHLACEMPLTADIVIILRTRPSALAGRLKRRGYGKKMIDTNVMAELLDYCTQRAAKNYDKRLLAELDTTSKTYRQCADRILLMLRKKRRFGMVDYSNELKKYLRLR